MKVFVTGASGYIGLEVVKELVAHGHVVNGLTRSDAGANAIKAAGATPVRGDIKDLDFVREQAAAADATIHCAFDNSFTDFPGACADEKRVLEAVGDVYEGTNKILIMSSGTLMGAGIPGFDEDSVPPPSEHNPRVANELFLRTLGDRGMRAVAIRLAPMTHGNDTPAGSFALVQIAAHCSAGFAATVSDNAWPATNVADTAALYRLALEQAPPGASAYHAVGSLTPITDIARLTAEKYNLPIKHIAPEEAPAHFGFIGAFLPVDNSVSSKLTQERLGWKPVKPTMLDELKAGNYWDLVVVQK